MSVRIVDRRDDSKGKSTVNRQRFMRRFKTQIRKAVADAISDRSVTDLEKGESVSIPARDLNEPNFRHGKGGIWEQVFTGNDRYTQGDQIGRPSGGSGGGGGGQASDSGEHEDDFTFVLSREEFMDLFFEDMELPRLVRKMLGKAKEYKMEHAGIATDGTPSNLRLARTRQVGIGRKIGMTAESRKALQDAQHDLEVAIECQGEESDEVAAIRFMIGELRARIARVPFIDTFDLRFNVHQKVPKPTTQAVMFCLMDVSGSMDEERKDIAKRFFMLLHLFLVRQYEHVEIVFIRHHTQAKEVGEDEFFHSRESGGTVVSSALELMREIIKERYVNGQWNIYGAQASDGDNWDNDSPGCRQLLSEAGGILSWCQYYAYIEIADSPQGLWKNYEQVAAAYEGKFEMRRVKEPADVYPVLHELFKKEAV